MIIHHIYNINFWEEEQFYYLKETQKSGKILKVFVKDYKTILIA